MADLLVSFKQSRPFNKISLFCMFMTVLITYASSHSWLNAGEQAYFKNLFDNEAPNLKEDPDCKVGFDADKQGYLLILIAVHVIQLSINSGSEIAKDKKKQKSDINSSLKEYNKHFFKLAGVFLLMDAATAGVLIPALMTSPNCPSLVR